MKQAVTILIIEASMPEIVKTFVSQAHESIHDLGVRAENLFIKVAMDNEYTEQEANDGLEEGVLSRGDWGLFITWSVAE